MSARVLLITPEFYGVEKVLKSVLEKSDYEVTWLENKTLTFDYHGTKSKFKFLRKLYFLIFLPHVRYLRKWLNKMDNLKFDILFSINAHIICPYIFKRLKSINPELFSVLYLWDSFSMYDWSRELKLFNKVYTFDSEDSIRYSLEYRPNFYIRNGNNTREEIKYDLFFVGKLSPDRLMMMDKLTELTERSDIKTFLRLWPAYKIFFHNRFIYNFFKTFNLKGSWVTRYRLNFEAVEGILIRKYLIKNRMSYDEVQRQLFCSNVILDLPYELQTGYTHRVIEALANGRKIITTNSYIRKESFYNPDQIHIIDNLNPEINFRWIMKRSEFPVDKYFSELEISEWIKTMVNVGIC